MQCRVICQRAVILLFAALIAGPVFAEPVSVAGINAKVQGLYGHVDGDELKAGGISLTFPLCPHSGVQLDAGYGELGEDQLKGVGLHLFTRNPENYLFGILGAHAEQQNVDLNRVGFEGELYNGPVTIASFLGKQLGDIDDTFFGILDLRWYPVDNLMLVTGGSLADNNDRQLHLGAEYLIVAGLSAYVDLATGENHYEHALFGLRYYLGGQKRLVARHRQDDLNNPIINNLLQGLNSIREKQQTIGMGH